MSFLHTTIDRPARTLALIVIVTVLVLDLASKFLMLDIMLAEPNPAERIIRVTSFFDLVLVWNYGISFSLLSGGTDAMRWGLVGATSLIVCVVIVLMLRAHDRFQLCAYALVVGGALGNIFDRIYHGAVVDFLSFHVSGFYWPAFNVADSAISIGVAMLLYDGIIRERRRSAVRHSGAENDKGESGPS